LYYNMDEKKCIKDMSLSLKQRQEGF
jgi:hypothetical protein